MLRSYSIRASSKWPDSLLVFDFTSSSQLSMKEAHVIMARSQERLFIQAIQIS